MDSNSGQANSSSPSNEMPSQGRVNTPRPQNPHSNVASQTLLIRPPRQPNPSAVRVDNRAHFWMGRSSMHHLPSTRAEVRTPFPPLQPNTRAHLEHMHVQRQERVYPQAATRELEHNVIIVPRDNRRVNLGLSLSTPTPMEYDRSMDNTPIIISSGYSTYLLEDNEVGESSSRSTRVTCKKRTMNPLTPSECRILDKNWAPRNVRQRVVENNMELHQLLPENHHNGSAPFSSQLRANMHNPYNHFRNVPPLANSYMNPRPGVNYITSRGGDYSSTPRLVGPNFGDHLTRQDATGSNYHWILNPNPMRNPVLQLQQGNPRNQLVLYQPHNSSVGPNNLLVPASTNTSPIVVFRALREQSSNQAPVRAPMSSVGIVIRELGSSPLSSIASSVGVGGDIPEASSSSTVVPTQQTSGNEVVPYTGNQVLNIIPEESGNDEEFIYEEFDDDESSEDESKGLDFDATDISFEVKVIRNQNIAPEIGQNFIKLDEEEKGGANSGLTSNEIEKLIKKVKYASAEVSSPKKEEESCPICWENYIDENDMGELQCGHGYHLECLKKWLEIKNNCPICEKTTILNE